MMWCGRIFCYRTSGNAIQIHTANMEILTVQIFHSSANMMQVWIFSHTFYFHSYFFSIQVGGCLTGPKPQWCFLCISLHPDLLKLILKVHFFPPKITNMSYLPVLCNSFSQSNPNPPFFGSPTNIPAPPLWVPPSKMLAGGGGYSCELDPTDTHSMALPHSFITGFDWQWDPMFPVPLLSKRVGRDKVALLLLSTALYQDRFR